MLEVTHQMLSYHNACEGVIARIDERIGYPFKVNLENTKRLMADINLSIYDLNYFAGALFDVVLYPEDYENYIRPKLDKLAESFSASMNSYAYLDEVREIRAAGMYHAFCEAYKRKYGKDYE